MSQTEPYVNCSCDVRPPYRESAIGSSMGRYAVYLAEVVDDTRVDPACSFHGDNGTMVARINV